MRIRTQYIVSVIMFGAAALFIAVYALMTSWQVERLNRQEGIVYNIERMADELGYLSGDYFLYREDRQRVRWDAKWAALSAELSGLAPGTPEERTIAESMKNNHLRLKAVFETAASAFGGKKPSIDGGTLQAGTQVAWSRMAVQNQGLAFDARRLYTEIKNRRERLTQTRSVLFVVLSGLFSLYLITNYLMVQRRLLRSITELRAGARIVGAGDLDHRVGVERADEIGELAGAFNQMTADLKNVTASKAELEREITERREAEKALRESEEKYRNLFTNMAEEVHFWQLVRDEAGRIKTWRLVDVNPPTLRTWGRRSVEEIRGRTTDEIFGPGAAEHYMPVVQKIMDEGVPYSFEDYFPHLDKHFRFTSVPLGEYFITTGADITAIKKTELALRSSEERLRLATEAAKIGAFDWNIQTGVNIWTPELEALYGLAPGEFGRTQSSWEQLVHPDDLAGARARVEQALATGALVEHEWRVVWPDGSVHWIAGRFQGFKDAAGRPLRLSGVNMDITARRQAEQALRESEEVLRIARAAARLGIHDYDVKTGRILWDDRVRELWGVGPDEPVTYETFMTGLHPDDRAPTQAAVDWSLDPAGDGRYVAVYRVINRIDGRERWIEATGQVSFEQGRPVRLVGTVLDVTERKHIEESLKKAHADLAVQMEERTKELRQKEVLLKEVHHRVKNNLQVISSLVRLQADGSKDETVREVLQDVTHRVRSMALVHEKLYQSADLARIDFAEYARSLLNYLWHAQAAAADRIRLTLDLKSVVLPVDIAVPCGLILNELAGNALKHAFRGRTEGEVTVSLHTLPPGGICLIVRDDGIGIPPDISVQQSGSLGLRLVQMLAGQLNAVLELDRGDGTEFRITFNLPEAARDREPLHE